MAFNFHLSKEQNESAEQRIYLFAGHAAGATVPCDNRNRMYAFACSNVGMIDTMRKSVSACLAHTS
jgi:hypothetical protein